MNPALKVIAPGLHTTVQDLGRLGYRDVGVPVSGPLDGVAFRLANALAGNDPNVPALEIQLQGPVLEVKADAVRVALVGGSGGLVIESEGGRIVPPGRSLRLPHGQRFRCTSLGEVGCACLAVEGGFDVPLCLGSAATYGRSRLGGLDGRALQPGDLLPLRLDQAPERVERALAQPLPSDLDAPIRVVLGPQDDYFTADAIASLLSASYTISPQSDRMGFRLQGPALAHAKGQDIVSDGVVTGAIQVPGSGRPIVLMADGQTTGGYPKIATVISVDLPRLGRRPPGAAVRFAAVTQRQAEALRRAQARTIVSLIDGFGEAAEPTALDQDALYSANLVGGVSDGSD